MKNNLVVITGGSRGLGKNAALALAKKGNDVIITYQNNKTEAEKTVAEIIALGQKAKALQLNTAESASFETFAVNLKEVLQTDFQTDTFNYLVNNAGIGIHKSFMETTEADFDLLHQIHVKGPFFLTQKLLPFIQKGGGIINISTGLARFSLPGYAAYATMKGGIEVLTRYMAKEFGPLGIRANTVAPGAIETDFGGGVVRDNKPLNDHIASQTALGRVGLPDDIGTVIAFLCSADSQWVNAQRIEVSGGMFI